MKVGCNKMNDINFRGNRRISDCNRFSKRVRKRRTKLTFLEQQSIREEVQMKVFREGKMKYCER